MGLFGKKKRKTIFGKLLSKATSPVGSVTKSVFSAPKTIARGGKWLLKKDFEIARKVASPLARGVASKLAPGSEGLVDAAATAMYGRSPDNEQSAALESLGALGAPGLVSLADSNAARTAGRGTASDGGYDGSGVSGGTTASRDPLDRNNDGKVSFGEQLLGALPAVRDAAIGGAANAILENTSTGRAIKDEAVENTVKEYLPYIGMAVGGLVLLKVLKVI